jgi:hypothetical protein
MESFAEAAEAAVVDVAQRVPEGMGPIEQALAAQIRAAAQQLRGCADQLARDPLMVTGSTGQRRAHPLLKVAQDLRREITTAIKDLTFRAEQRGIYERLKGAHAARRAELAKDAE